jgi:hypothetical protein
MIRLDYKLVEGYQEEKPLAVDLTSSQAGVYLRKDFRLVNNKDLTGQHWQYKEAFLTLEEYQECMNEKESVTLTTIMQTLSEIQMQIDEIAPEEEYDDEE